MVKLLKLQEDILSSIKNLEGRDKARSVELSQFLAKMECASTRTASSSKALIPPQTQDRSTAVAV